MGRRADIEKQMRDLQKELEESDPDEDLEVWVKKDGVETKLTGARAKRWLDRHGYDEDETGTPAEPLEAKPAAKKAAASKRTRPTVAAGPRDDDDEDLADDDAGPATGHKFFR